MPNRPANPEDPAGGKKGKKTKAGKDKTEVKFSTYIAKAHKNIHGADRTVSAAALSTLDMMADHLITELISNGKKTMKYSKTNTFNKSCAGGAATLTLTGMLRTSATNAGKAATEAFVSHAPLVAVP
jgi:hypothetical protein